MFDDDFKHRVRDRSDIAAIIGQHVTLKQTGKEFLGLCPFHDDHSPSMHVVPNKQIFKCFSCGAVGDVFGFVQKFHRMTFPEALQYLAERAGVPIPERSQPRDDGRPTKRTLANVLTWAAEFFQQRLLHADDAQPARDYIEQRGLSDNTVEQFHLGYAPAGWDHLLTAGLKAGYDLPTLIDAGLVKPRPTGSGHYDLFRDRLIFPIRDATQRVIAFGGRTLGDDKPKYLNSPASSLFDKSRCLFGIDLARVSAGDSGCMIVVEGYTDVCMCQQFGVTNVVATLGTALTNEHVALLKRYAPRLVVVYDGDAAGLKATDRALDVGLACGQDIWVAAIPQNGLDPCDLLLKHGRPALEDVLARAEDGLQVLFGQVLGTLGPHATYEQRDAAVRRFIRSVAQAASVRRLDDIQRGFMVNHLQRVVGLQTAEIQRELQPPHRANTVPPAHADALAPVYHELLGLMLAWPELVPTAIGQIDLQEIRDFRLFCFIKQILDRHDLGQPISLVDMLDAYPHQPTQQWLIELEDRTEQSGSPQERLDSVLHTLQEARDERSKLITAQRLRTGQHRDMEAELTDLMQRARKPDARRVGPRVG